MKKKIVNIIIVVIVLANAPFIIQNIYYLLFKTKKEYYDSGELKRKHHFTNIGDSIVDTYYKNSILKSSFCYTDGKLKEVIKVHENSFRKEFTHYKNGLKTDTSRTFYNNGKLRSQCVYKKGKLEGVSLYYYRNSNIFTKILYENDKLVSDYDIFDKDGRILLKVDKKDSNLELHDPINNRKESMDILEFNEYLNQLIMDRLKY